MKQKIGNPIKGVKKAFYRGRATKFKRLIAYMLVGGLLASTLYVCRYSYIEYAVSKAHVVLSYPEIAGGKYPDGSRFAYYDFVQDDRLAEALSEMQKNGKYKYFTVEDLRDSFYVYAELEDSASSHVSSARMEGNDFSYVANEYRVTFVQPHAYKNPNLFAKFFAPDESCEFLEALLRANKKYISEEKGGISGFSKVSAIGDTDGYDYDEKIQVYKTKKRAVTAYLSALEKSTPKFFSETHGVSLKDLRGRYDLVITNRLDSIANFVDSSGLSKNPESTTNKIQVNIENNLLKYNKIADEAVITEYAMTNYDHTFTENLINVVRDKTQGLYQARPKTSFDSVVTQMNAAKESVSEYQETLNTLNADLVKFGGGTAVSEEERARLLAKCETLFAELEKEYADLTSLSEKVVAECLAGMNGEFLKAEVKEKPLFSTKLAAKTGIVFLVGATFMFVICTFISVWVDGKKLREKKRLLAQIKMEKKGA